MTFFRLTRIQRGAIYCCGAMLAMTGCAGMDDSTQTTLQGTAVGGVAGALVGALTCKGDSKCIAAYTAGGMVAGTVAGFAISKRKQTYASKEEAISEEIAWNQKFTQEVQTENQSLKRKIAAHKTEIAQAKRSTKSLQQRQVALNQTSRALEQDIRTANQQLASVNKELDESKRKRQQYGSDPKWQREIVKLEKARDGLRSNVNTMTAMNGSLGV